MRQALTVIFFLLTLALAGGFWLDADALVPRWEDRTTLQIQTPTRSDFLLGSRASLELHGEGLSEGTRAWLVPETTQRMSIAGSLKTWGNPYQLKKIGNRVYLANGRNGILALDLSDWTQPRLLGAMQLDGQAFDLAVSGTRVFVACGSGGLQVVDFKEPTAPQLVTALKLPGPALALELRDNRLYIAGARAGLLVVDIANPAQPLLLAQSVTPNPALDITLSGTSALLACGRGGIVLFDISAPQRPRHLGGINRHENVRCLMSNGAIVYVGSAEPSSVGRSNKLATYDCANPSRLRLLSEQPLSGDPASLQIEQQELVVAQTYNGISVFSLAAPERPTLSEEIKTIGLARAAILEGDWLLIADSSGYLHTTLRNSQLDLPIVSSIPERLFSTPLLYNDLLLIPHQNSTLQVYSVAAPDRPELLASLPLPGCISSMLLRDEQLFLAINPQIDISSPPQAGILVIVSLADPAHPKILSSLSFPSTPVDLALDGNRLIVVTLNEPVIKGRRPLDETSGRLFIVDLSKINQPTIRYTLELAQNPSGMAWRDGHAFISMEEGMMAIVQVPEERPPELVSELKFHWLHQGRVSAQGGGRGGGLRGGIKHIGSVAAVNTGVTELSFIDTAVPSRPVFLGTCEIPGNIGQMEVFENSLYVGITNTGIAIYDLSLPWQPRYAGLLPMPKNTRFFTLSDEVLWYSSFSFIGLTCIPRPQLAETSIDAAGQTLALKFSTPPAPGDYSLWVERDNNWQEVPNSVRFRAR